MDPVANILGTKPIKEYPKPNYMKCNQGHILRRVYDKRRHNNVWDCPICINKMGLGHLYDTL